MSAACVVSAACEMSAAAEMTARSRVAATAEVAAAAATRVTAAAAVLAPVQAPRPGLTTLKRRLPEESLCPWYLMTVTFGYRPCPCTAILKPYS